MNFTPFYGSMLVLDLLASQLISINVYALELHPFFLNTTCSHIRHWFMLEIENIEQIDM